jgi:hypothetical protein
MKVNLLSVTKSPAALQNGFWVCTQVTVTLAGKQCRRLQELAGFRSKIALHLRGTGDTRGKQCRQHHVTSSCLPEFVLQTRGRWPRNDHFQQKIQYYVV